VLRRPWERPLREGTGDVRGPPPLRRAAARYVDARAAARLGLALDAPDVGRLFAGHRPVRGSGRRRDRVRLPAPEVYFPMWMGRGGGAAEFHVDTRDQPRAARHGITFDLGGSYYARALDVTSPFGEGHAEASSYLTARIPLHPTLALRVGGKKVWGTFDSIPFYEMAYIGGATT